MVKNCILTDFLQSSPADPFCHVLYQDSPDLFPYPSFGWSNLAIWHDFFLLHYWHRPCIFEKEMQGNKDNQLPIRSLTSVQEEARGKAKIRR
jgi:hypothetical protein